LPSKHTPLQKITSNHHPLYLYTYLYLYPYPYLTPPSLPCLLSHLANQNPNLRYI